jgi:DNA replication initiation complex subunit (GINS family)
MIETKELYERLEAMTEQERVEILDPICDAVKGKAKVHGMGVEVIANRIFALAVLDLYKEWQQEIWDRE